MAKSLSPTIKSKLSDEVKAEISDIITKMHEILVDNQPFFNELMEAFPRDDMDRTSLDNMLWEAYPDLLNTLPRGIELRGLVYDLNELIAGRHKLVRDEIAAVEKGKYEQYYAGFCANIASEISKVFHSFHDGAHEVSLTGDLE